MPILPSPLGLRTRVYDSDAVNYFSRVEAQDGQPLEQGVRNAINNFIIGCKNDLIWNAFVAIFILCGARTMDGARQRIIGSSNLNLNNFISSDYSRTLGFSGDGSSKFLNSGYSNANTTDFPQNDSHISCYISRLPTFSNKIHAGTTINPLQRHITIYTGSTAGTISLFNRSSGNITVANPSLGFFGSSRNNSSNFEARASTSSGYQNSTLTSTSGTPSGGGMNVLASNVGTGLSDARISFFSAGKSLDLTLLQTRVDKLISDIASALA